MSVWWGQWTSLSQHSGNTDSLYYTLRVLVIQSTSIPMFFQNKGSRVTDPNVITLQYNTFRAQQKTVTESINKITCEKGKKHLV